jgi:hypothetical protein
MTHRNLEIGREKSLIFTSGLIFQVELLETKLITNKKGDNLHEGTEKHLLFLIRDTF